MITAERISTATIDCPMCGSPSVWKRNNRAILARGEHKNTKIVEVVIEDPADTYFCTVCVYAHVEHR